MKKPDDRFENMRFQEKRKYILKSLDSKSKMRFVSDEESKFVKES